MTKQPTNNLNLCKDNLAKTPNNTKPLPSDDSDDSDENHGSCIGTGNTEIQRLVQKYDLEVSKFSGSIKWTGEALEALMNHQEKRNPRERGSYKKKPHLNVYTVKLSSAMIQWLRQHDGSKLIRNYVKSLMGDSQNSVIPPPIQLPQKSSLSSLSSTNEVPITQGVNVAALVERLNSNVCARCHEEFFTDDDGVSDETEYVPGLGLCHKECEAE